MLYTLAGVFTGADPELIMKGGGRGGCTSMTLCNRVHKARILSTGPPEGGMHVLPMSSLDPPLLQWLWVEIDNDIHGSIDAPLNMNTN